MEEVLVAFEARGERGEGGHFGFLGCIGLEARRTAHKELKILVGVGSRECCFCGFDFSFGLNGLVTIYGYLLS